MENEKKTVLNLILKVTKEYEDKSKVKREENSAGDFI